MSHSLVKAIVKSMTWVHAVRCTLDMRVGTCAFSAVFLQLPLLSLSCRISSLMREMVPEPP